MAVRALKRFLCIALLLGLTGPAFACFGPKLFLGAGDRPEEQVLAAFVAIYVKETTGTDVERLPIEANAIADIDAERIDMAFSTVLPNKDVNVLMHIEGLPDLICGVRIDNDLQFTTVRPTLQRLAAKLSQADVMALTAEVASGQLAMDVVRQFLIERRWI